MHAVTLIIFLIVTLTLTTALLPWSASNSIESFVYAGCTQLRYAPGSPYESNLNSMLSSFVNSASSSSFRTFKISLPGSADTDVLYGLFQCRGDLSAADCRRCVAAAVTQLGGAAYCSGAAGGALQLDGCFVKYDNASFVGAVDESVVYSKCGGPTYDDDEVARRDGVLAYLGAGSSSGEYFRVGGSGRVQGAVQCVEDLSVGECGDCLSEAIRRLRSECGASSSSWGDVFLGKCYARYSTSSVSESGDLRRSGRWWWFVVVSILCFVWF